MPHPERADSLRSRSSNTNSVICSYARDITFKNVRIAVQNSPFAEDHSQDIRRLGWTKVPSGYHHAMQRTGGQIGAKRLGTTRLRFAK